MRIDLVVKKDCALCDDARRVLAELADELSIEIKEIDLHSDPAIHARYRYDVPVALLEGKVIAKHRIDARELRRRLPASFRQGKAAGKEDSAPAPESSGIRPVVRVSISQVAAASSARQQVLPSPYAKKKEVKKEPVSEPLPPLQLPPLDGRIFEVGGFLGAVDQRRMESWVEGAGEGPRVHVGPALGKVVVPQEAAEAFQENLLAGGYEPKGPGPRSAAVAAGLSLVLGLLAWVARTTFASFPLAAVAAAASVFPLLWVAGGKRPLRLLSSGSVLPLAASVVLWIDGFLRGGGAAIEWAAAPAFAQGLLLALALGARDRLQGALGEFESRLGGQLAKTGETIEVQEGETLPADGRLLEPAEVDESPLGGDEKSPKQAGELVWAGSRFPEGGSVRVGKAGASRLERALALAERALGTSAPRPDDPLVRFLPLGAVGAALVAGLLHGAPAAAAALAVVPAIALVLSVSFAESGGILAALRGGVAVRSAAVVRRAAKIRRVLLGKRAALERGDPLVLSTLPRPDHEPDEVLRLAGLAARGVEHPICRAMVAHAVELGLLKNAEVPAESAPGEFDAGASKTIEGKRVLVGTLGYLAKEGVDVEGVASFPQAIGRRGSSPAGVAIDGELALLVEMGDRLAAHGRSAIGALEGLGSDVRIASGGPQASGAWSAEAMGLDPSAATGGLSADGKAELVERLHPVLFAGGFKDEWCALEVADLSLLLGSDLAPLDRVDALALLPDARAVATLQRIASLTRVGVSLGNGLAWGGTALGIGLVLAGALSPIGAVVLATALSAASLGLAILPAAFFR